MTPSALSAGAQDKKSWITGPFQTCPEAVETGLRHLGILREAHRRETHILAEEVSGFNRRLDGFRDEVAREFKAVRLEMGVGFAAVREEMAAGFLAQGELIQGLGKRVERLEAKPA